MVLDRLLKRKFIRFVVAGALNYVLITPATYVLTEYAGMFYFYAYALVFSVALVVNFVFSLKWIFEVRGRMTDRVLKYAIYLVAFYAANMALVRFFTEILDIHYVVSITVVTGGLFVLKYFTYKSQVFYETAP